MKSFYSVMYHHQHHAFLLTWNWFHAIKIHFLSYSNLPSYACCTFYRCANKTLTISMHCHENLAHKTHCNGTKSILITFLLQMHLLFNLLALINSKNLYLCSHNSPFRVISLCWLYPGIHNKMQPCCMINSINSLFSFDSKLQTTLYMAFIIIKRHTLCLYHFAYMQHRNKIEIHPNIYKSSTQWI